MYTQSGLVIRELAGTPPARSIALAWRASFTRPGAIEVLTQAIWDCQ